MSGARNLGGTSISRSAYGANSTRADSPYLLPAQSILHGEEIPHSPLNIRAILFFGLFAWGVVGLFVGAFYLALHIFGVV